MAPDQTSEDVRSEPQATWGALFHEGEPGDHVVLLLDGTVKLTATAEDSRLALLGILVGGNILGAPKALDGLPTEQPP